jgi:hypothetical protein
MQVRHVPVGAGDLRPQHRHRGTPGTRSRASAGLPGRTLDATFIGAVAGATMESIKRGEVAAMTGFSSATAYWLLADLIVAAVTGGTRE